MNAQAADTCALSPPGHRRALASGWSAVNSSSNMLQESAFDLPLSAYGQDKDKAAAAKAVSGSADGASPARSVSRASLSGQGADWHDQPAAVASPAADPSVPEQRMSIEASPPRGSSAWWDSSRSERSSWQGARLSWQLAAQPPQQPLQQQQQQQQQQAMPATVPPGMDAQAYIAGERAAFLSAYQQALPSQQALGQLFGAVDSMHGRLQEEAGHWRAVQLQSQRVSQTLEAAQHRLDTIEYMQLPRLQEKWEEAACRLPEQHQAVTELLGDVLALLREQQATLQAAAAAGSGASSTLGAAFPARQLWWLLATAAGYGQAALSKADVAAVFLSRKVLLADLLPSGAVGTAAQRQLRAALSAALFVAAVEGLWQAHERVLQRSPALVQRAAAPLQLSLKVARVTVWSAALVLSVAQLRSACNSAAASTANALAQLKMPGWACRQMWPGLWWRGSAAEAGVEAAVQSEDHDDTETTDAA